MARKRNSDNYIVSTGGGAAAARRTQVTRPTLAAETPVSPVPQSSVSRQPEYREIAELAYSYWAARGFSEGNPEEDWCRAEQELAARYSA
jgi:shikimate kinase